MTMMTTNTTTTKSKNTTTTKSKKTITRRFDMATQRHRSWAEIRSEKIPAGQEAAQAASAQALRDALDLKGLRTGHGITQAELAARLGKSQGNVSELERRDDVYLSSLREYVEALGGKLEISAVFEDERTPIAIG